MGVLTQKGTSAGIEEPHSPGTSVGSGWPSSPSPEREARCHLSGLLSRPGLQTFSETAHVCLHISPPVFAVVNIVCPIGKVINKGVEMWLSVALKVPCLY